MATGSYRVSKIEDVGEGRYKVTAKDTDESKQKHQNVTMLTDDPSSFHVGQAVRVEFVAE